MPFPLPDSITNSFNAEYDFCPSEDNEPSVPKASGVEGGAPVQDEGAELARVHLEGKPY